MAKVIRYLITAKPNYGNRRIIKEFKTKSEARKYIKKLIAPGKLNKSGIRQTAYRDALSGSGINNPRIIKREVYR